ncbi:MAG: septation protein IspZ [Burkholderiales bacterium]|nr:septation protein IspZ [Burkholderiales bacterium]
MDFFIDLVPALPFLLVAFSLVDMFTATKLAMAAALLQLGASRLRYGRIKRMHAITFAAIVVFGSVTLLLKDDYFIKIKPTVLNWGFALVFLGAPILFRKNLLQLMLADKIAMPARAWARLNLMWVAYFAAIGGANLYVATYLSPEAWGKFRVFGMYGALLVFMVLQGFYVYRHMTEVAEPAPAADDPPPPP